MGCDQCQNSLCQKTVHTSHIPVYSLKLGVCVLTCWKQVVCIAEIPHFCNTYHLGGMCYGYVSVAEMGVCICVAEMGVCVVEMWGMYISCKNGGLCCRKGVCVVEMWGMYISCKNGGLCCRKGVCVVEMWGMYISCKNGGRCCGNVGYVYQLQKWENVLWKCGVCISCRNGGMCCGNGGMYVNVGYVSEMV